MINRKNIILWSRNLDVAKRELRQKHVAGSLSTTGAQ